MARQAVVRPVQRRRRYLAPAALAAPPYAGLLSRHAILDMEAILGMELEERLPKRMLCRRRLCS